MDNGARFPNGEYRAKAVGYQFGKTSNGNDQIAVEFELTADGWSGQRITWYGYFTEKAFERTVESLRHCGWEGDDLRDMGGIDANEVSLKIGIEEYEGKTRSRVRFVNKIGGGEFKSPMNDAEFNTFAASMRSKIAAMKAGKGGAPPKSNGAKPEPAKPAATTEDGLPF